MRNTEVQDKAVPRATVTEVLAHLQQVARGTKDRLGEEAQGPQF